MDAFPVRQWTPRTTKNKNNNHDKTQDSAKVHPNSTTKWQHHAHSSDLNLEVSQLANRNSKSKSDSTSNRWCSELLVFSSKGHSSKENRKNSEKAKLKIHFSMLSLKGPVSKLGCPF